MSEHELPRKGLVRLPVILNHIPVSKSTWWSGVKSGIYPKGKKLGRNITAWNAEEIWQLIETGLEDDSGNGKSE